MKFTFETIKKELQNNSEQLTSEQIQAIEDLKKEMVGKLLKYGISSKNDKVFDAMIAFMAEDKLEHRKTGMLFYGSVGTGKTFCLKVISAVKGYSFYNADELLLLHIEKPEAFWEQMKERKNIIIDDLGCEQVRADFGARYELLGQALQVRHRLWQSAGILTLLSTNLDGEAIKQRYSERLYSRIKQMCEPINTGKTDLRN